MPGARATVSKIGEDALGGDLVNMAFDTRYNLNKIARAIKSEGTAATEHGLTYTPKILAMREVPTGKFAYGASCVVDSTYIYPNPGTDDATWTYILVDPLTTGSFKKRMKGRPCILIGDGKVSDYDYKLHSGYDTFKVFTTGTLTIEADAYDPGSGGGTDTQTATFNHGLGYAPIFAPFVEYETDLYFYYMANGTFNTSIVNGGTWQASAIYKTGEDVMDSGSVLYTCIKTHTSSAADEPGVGVNWSTYWELAEDVDYTNTYVNNLEDTKVNLWVFGDDGQHNYYYIYLYSTSTQLVLEYKRVVTASDEPIYTYEPEPAGTVTVDYTVFYNRADEEFNLLIG